MPGERIRCSKSERLVTRERISSWRLVKRGKLVAVVVVVGEGWRAEGREDGKTNLGEDFLFFEFAQLRGCALQVEARLV